MARADTHVVRIERGTVDSTWRRWVCTCGKRSKLFGYAGLAQQAGRRHAEALGGFMDPLGRMGRG